MNRKTCNFKANLSRQQQRTWRFQLIVQEGCDESCTRPLGTVSNTFVRTNSIVCEDTALSYNKVQKAEKDQRNRREKLELYTANITCYLTLTVKPPQDIESIVREETFEVEGIRKQLSHCRAAHLLVMLVLIKLHKGKTIQNYYISYSQCN